MVIVSSNLSLVLKKNFLDVTLKPSQRRVIRFHSSLQVGQHNRTEV